MPRKLNELEVRKQYQIKISNRFAALNNFSDSEDINRAWENIKEHMKTSAKERLDLHILKQHKPWSEEKCSQYLDQGSQAKMQWLQGSNQGNAENLNNVRRQDSRHFRNNKKEYLKAKIEKLEINCKFKSYKRYRGISDFKKGHQPKPNIVKDEKGNLVTDSNIILVGGGAVFLSYWMYMGLMMFGTR
jgi:hypothetical protein